MEKQYIFLGVVFATILCGVGLYFVLPDESAEGQIPTGIVFYYGDTCPHCKIVEDYVVQNSIKEKVSFEEKEVYNNEKNSAELKRVARKCDIAADEIGVPLLWVEGKCLVGDKDIIAFFEEKIGTQQ